MNKDENLLFNIFSSMANNLSASFIEVWAKEQQEVFYKVNRAMVGADMSFNAQMRKGDTLNRPYRSSAWGTVAPYVRGTAITITDLTDTNQQLSVSQEFANGFYVDDFDQIQDNYDIAATYGKDFGMVLSNQVDADFLGEAANATSTLDNSAFGGTAGDGISLTAANIPSIFGAARRLILKQNVPPEDLKAFISPEFEEMMVQAQSGRDTRQGDEATANGFIGKYYGFECYTTNQLSGSAVLALATQPTNLDTVTINVGGTAITFTFVSSIGTTAGNVLIGVDVDTTRANLAGAINNPSTTSATQVALSTTNANILSANATATNSNSADTLTVVVKGTGVLVVSETLTDATDTWTTAKQIQQNLFIAGRAPTMVMQKTPGVQVKEVPDKLGKNILNGCLYGVKTFNDNAKRMVNVKVASSGYAASVPNN